LKVFGRDEAASALPSSVGAKAATLARLARAGVPVPDFSVLSSRAFALHLAENRIPWPAPGNLPADLARLRALREQIRAAPMPEAVSRPALEAYDRLCSMSGHGQVAVRSSGGEEDAASTSFAGQFSSILGVESHVDLLDAVKECWASYLSDRSLSYRAGLGMALGPAPSLGVMIQVQILSEKAGVLFTVHPLEPDEGTSCIEANFGTGESVVGGLVTPDVIAISRSNAQVIESRIATKRRMTSVSPGSRGSRVASVEEARQRSPVLTESEVEAIFRIGLRIEELMGGPQDVEWAFDARGLWILQARPITGRNREPR
jgi:phosphoenolpyruvate synthase/pyruvate phosphate dikinase